VREAALREPMVERFRSVLSHEWELGSVLRAFDTWADEVHEAALRDESLWSSEYAAYFSGRDDLTTHEEEVEYVREWIIARYAHVEAHFWASGAAAGADIEADAGTAAAAEAEIEAEAGTAAAAEADIEANAAD
jgi:hypothetical protein